MTPDQARDALKGSAMTVGKIVKVDGTLTGTPEGRIVAQLPEPGSTAQQGQPVQLMVSTGIVGKKTFLPDVRGFQYEDARTYARDAGLVITKVTPQPSDQKEGTVLEQTPAAFKSVPVGSPVTLTVAAPRYSAPSRPAGSLPCRRRSWRPNRNRRPNRTRSRRTRRARRRRRSRRCPRRTRRRRCRRPPRAA